MRKHSHIIPVPVIIRRLETLIEIDEGKLEVQKKIGNNSAIAKIERSILKKKTIINNINRLEKWKHISWEKIMKEHKLRAW